MEDTEVGVTLQADATIAGRYGRRGSERLQRGDALGRYVVIDVLGQGGMGVVYAAYDPELGRSVAIKLLQSEQVSTLGTSDGRGRLLREAQALAQLQHANVITVHDVGEHQGQIFVAMEHIHGITLRRWLDAEPRPWREVLEVMQRAGLGLRAAHAKGMVHRDFKPDNVMLATDESGAIERVLVMDFGLATPAGHLQPSPAFDSAPLAAASLSSSEQLASLTRTGAVMGTPAYMAPEQHAGARTDDRTDQFAFCVTLYEALYGQRPFAGETLAALVAACFDGRIEAAPRGSAVPRWVREIVERGLHVDPEHRWPSMAALLDALGKDPTRARRRLTLALLGATAIVLGAAGWVLVERSRLASCRAAADSIDEVWSAEARARAEGGVLGTGMAYASSTWEHLEPLIDDQTERWRTLRYDACTDRRSVPPALHDVQDQCFESSKLELADVLEILAEADRTVLDRAASALGNWADRSRCSSPAELARRPPWPDEPEARARVVALDRTIRRAFLMSYAGRYEEAERLATASIDEAALLEQLRPLAVARQARGLALILQGRSEEAELAYEEAFFAARRSGSDDVAALVAAKLGDIVGYELARGTEGRRWLRHAEILADEAGLDAIDRAFIDQMSGVLELADGKLAAARERFEAALAVYEATDGLASIGTHDALSNLAYIHIKLGEHELAVAKLERVLAWCERMYGPDHLLTADAHNNLAVTLLENHQFEEARPYLERTIAFYEKAGLDNKLGSPLDNLVIILRETGHGEEALEVSGRAIEVRRRTLPAEHPDIGNSLINRGQVLVRLGREQEAIPAYTAALELYERALGPDHPRIGEGAYILAMAFSKIGDHRRALVEHQRGLRIRRATLPAEHRNIAWSTLGTAIEARFVEDYAATVEAARPLMVAPDAPKGLPLVHRSALMWMFGEALLETGRLEEAMVWLERAEALADAPEQEAANRADIHFALARARWEAGMDRPAALVLARDALVVLRKENGVDPMQIERVERWLAGHEMEVANRR